ncbi:hypothetical protein CBER1_08732 [Cercospora berteroae]|uniref:Protein kinase domain-containing protein n=1 Tax=Cercospora berteroae TaxID=357750 RepID=A0A2S6CAC9_9PEZI|nr:hypothetical protein CBER1_08732 [Cercospora berteroae]
MPPTYLLTGRAFDTGYSPPLTIRTRNRGVFLHIGSTIRYAESKISGDCVVVTEGKHGVVDVIVKIFGSHDTAPSIDHMREVRALKRLKRAKCKHVPKYIANISKTYEGLLGPYTEHYIVMEKVPGEPLHDLSQDELKLNRKCIEQALKDACEAVWRGGVDHRNMLGRNVLYDHVENKCYLIDFERWWSTDGKMPDSSKYSLDNWIWDR